MRSKSTVATLASFATLKHLSDTNHYVNTYQVLAEFISHIISTEKLYIFTSIEMKNKLYSVFGFDIPEAVVKTATKSLSFVKRENGTFLVDRQSIAVSPDFTKTAATVSLENCTIVNALNEYAKNNRPDVNISEEDLSKALIAFLIEDCSSVKREHLDLVGEFVLKNEGNSSVQDILRTIQEGSILYLGLNYNIHETGSITKPITLFLGTEVMFSLVGFNGEVYKKLAQDFYEQVRIANTNGSKVSLQFFDDTKKEMDAFFDAAIGIVEGRTPIVDRAAMKAIVNNCTTKSDIEIKRSDFYHTLKFSYGITEAPKCDFYSKENEIYNLESIEHCEEKEAESWKFVSHINKLRNGKVFFSDVDSEYLLVTNTRAILKASAEQSELDREKSGLERVSDYAVSVNHITNIFWYKLGNGFGHTAYPSNVDAILRARTVLASSIAHNIAEVYQKAKKQFDANEISEDKYVARIIALRNKSKLPEELQSGTIEEDTDFSTEAISRYEEEHESNKQALLLKEAEINSIHEANRQSLAKKDSIISEKDSIISQKDLVIQEKDKKATEMEQELSEYRRQEILRRQRKKKIVSWLKFLWTMTWKVAILALIIFAACKLEDKYDSKIPVYVGIAVDSIGLFLTGLSAVKKDFKRCFAKEMDSKS